MSKFIVRSATVEDHKALVALAKTSKYTKDFSNRMMFSSDAAYEKGWIRLAEEEDGTIIGFTCVRHKSRFPETMLYFIVVDPEYRSQGIGEILIKDAVQHAPTNMMRLNVMKDNTQAKKFYDRLGFTVAGVAIDGTAWSLEKEFQDVD